MCTKPYSDRGGALDPTAFTGAQFGWLGTRSRSYLVLNLVGSAILAVLAWIDDQWGFLLLEGVWAVVSGWSLLRIAPAFGGRSRV